MSDSLLSLSCTCIPFVGFSGACAFWVEPANRKPEPELPEKKGAAAGTSVAPQLALPSRRSWHFRRAAPLSKRSFYRAGLSGAAI